MSSRGAFVVSVATFGVVLAIAATELPDRVPMHFDATGSADRWAGRTEAIVTFGLLGLFVGGLFGGIAAATGRIPMSMVNVPHQHWWLAEPDRERRMRGLLRADMYWFAATTMALLTIIVALTLRASRLDKPHLDAWFWVSIGLYLAATFGYLFYCWRSRYRPEPEG